MESPASTTTETDSNVVWVTEDLVFSPGFESCRYRGQEMYFREKMAGILEALVLNYKKTKFTSMKNLDLLAYVYPPWKVRDHRVPDVFKVKIDGQTVKHEAWGLILGPGKVKGTTQLML